MMWRWGLFSKAILVVSFLILFSWPYRHPCRAETAILSLQFRDATEALPIIEGMLSENGRATADLRTNSLVVTDNEESIGKIRAFLARYDQPLKQVRIRVRFEEERASEGRSASAQGSMSGKGWKVQTGRKNTDGLEVRLQDRKGSQTRSSEYFVSVLSGSSAYILAGKDIPYTERWLHLCRKYACYDRVVSFHRIETGFEVRPVVLGDHARVEITPRISPAPHGDPQAVIRFTEASTDLHVPLGHWVRIGGTHEQSNEVIRAILQSGTGTGTSSLSISLMVEGY